MKLLRLASPLALLVVLSACAPSEPATPSEAATPATECSGGPFEVTITYEIVTDVVGGVAIETASNLPDGAELGASLYGEDGYIGQDNGVLEDGSVTFGPFSDKGMPLQGDYRMSITLPIARNQPEDVQACIGKSGELMTGPLVGTEDISGDKVASVNEVVTLG